MISRNRIPAVLLTLTLAGCVHFAIQNPTTDPETRMANIATRFQQDFNKGGMSEVIADIQRCHNETSAPLILVNSLRDCLVLDFTGYQTDRVFGVEILKGPPLPFFEPAVVGKRLDHYGYLAEFPKGPELPLYLENSYKMVAADIIAMHEQPATANRPLPQPTY